jgi:hypothetical protein
MRQILLTITAAGLLASPAWAADDVMAGFYGNTVVASGGMADVHIYYRPDHTFLMDVPAFHMEFRGTWKLVGSDICRTYDKPPPGADNPSCTPAHARKVGDTWTVTTGSETRTVTLLKGIQ